MRRLPIRIERLLRFTNDVLTCSGLGLPSTRFHHFVVAADQRGIGLGEAMLGAAIKNCISYGCSQVTLKVASESEGAQRSYRRHGFEKSDDQGAYLLIRRVLAP